MRLFPFIRRNRRWFRQVDAHVDGRLSPVERALLAERVDESASVRRALDDTLTVKRLLRTMPEHPAPRSFAITPAMLAATAPVAPPRAARLTMHLSQATALAAIAGFAVLVGVDLTDSPGSDSAASEAALPVSALTVDDGAGAADPDAKRSASDPVSDQGGQPEIAGSDPSNPPAQEAYADSAATGLAQREPTSEARDYLPLYASIGGVLALALGAWTLSRRQLRGRPARPAI